MTLDLALIARLRLRNQILTEPKLASPAEVVAWMGAIQAQDYPMAKWAIGARLPASTDKIVEAAIDKGEIIRTHVLRPTWHFIASEDVNWLLDLTGSKVKTIMGQRDRELELTEAVYSRSNASIEKALVGGKHLTRDELVAALNKAGIATDQNRASHLFGRAELEQIICSGEVRKGKPTYALLAERIRKTKHLTREQSLAELARRYFTSRGPATLQDFTWWSGLTAGAAREALEMIKGDFNSETVNERAYWFLDGTFRLKNTRTITHLLPPYDEYTLSYAYRSASIQGGLEEHMKVISDRGIFRPIVVIDGQVVGIWKRTIKKDRIIVDLQAFSKLDRSSIDLIDHASLLYGNFLEKQVELKF